MIVTLTPDGQSPITLSGGDKESPQNLRVAGKRVVQRAELLRAEAAKFFDRKNLSVSMSFDVSKTHASIEEAEVKVLEAPSLYCKAGQLAFTMQGASSAFTRFQTAVVESVEATHKGIVATYSFSIVCGGISKPK